MDHMNLNPHKDRNLGRSQDQRTPVAVFYDCQNVPATSVAAVHAHFAATGRIISQHAYADWSFPSVHKWRRVNNDYGIVPVQCDSIKGKNSCDIKMAVDIISMSESLAVPSTINYVIVSSDYDFRHVATTLRSNNKTVVGMGYMHANDGGLSHCGAYYNEYVHLNPTSSPANAVPVGEDKEPKAAAEAAAAAGCAVQKRPRPDAPRTLSLPTARVTIIDDDDDHGDDHDGKDSGDDHGDHDGKDNGDETPVVHVKHERMETNACTSGSLENQNENQNEHKDSDDEERHLSDNMYYLMELNERLEQEKTHAQKEASQLSAKCNVYRKEVATLHAHIAKLKRKNHAQLQRPDDKIVHL